MPQSSSTSRWRWVQWALVAIVIIGLVLGGPYSSSLRLGVEGIARVTLTPGRAVIYWLAWLPAVPALIVARRFRLTSTATPQLLALHIALGVAASLVHAITFGFAQSILSDPNVAARLELTVQSLWFQTLRGFWEYALFLAIVHVSAYVRALRDRDREVARQDLVRARLEAEVAQAQVAALQSQLHPHFLFNTLNSIAVLTLQEPRAAHAMVVQLGALLRTVTQSSREHLVPLRRELDFVDRYVSIQRMRFRERLRVDLLIEDEALDAVIPAMLLQPLVENAIRHAVEIEGEGTIVLRVCRVGDRLDVSVEDDGTRVAVASSGTGTGLENIQRRLLLLFGDRQSVEMHRRSGGGMVAHIMLPFVPAA